MPAEWATMARLLRRTGFGTTGDAVDRALAGGVAGHVSTVLAADPSQDPGALRTPLPSFEAVARPGAQASSAVRTAYRQAVREQGRELVGWWLQRMVAVHEPFGERLTFGWHEHFATSIAKVRQARWMAIQNATLRTEGRGDFRVLALSMLRDPAMLDWLDGERSTALSPNENLSREFMELFAMGHGSGYTEQDVREGARALTGWRVLPSGRSRLVPRRHDAGSKTLLGVTGNLDDVGYCDAVLAQPAVPVHLALKWWGRLMSSRPPTAAQLARLVAGYGPGRSVRGLLEAVLTAPELAAAAGTLVVEPVSWLVGAVRALKVPVGSERAAQLVTVLTGLGQVPFEPPSVGGWPAGAAWLSTASADLRMRAALGLAGAGDLSAVSDGPLAGRLESTGHLLGIATWSDRSAAALRSARDNPVALVAIALNTPEYLTA